MKKRKLTYLIIGVLALISVFSIITSCEKDDICADTPITPLLIITFEDAEKETGTRKEVVGLQIKLFDKNNIDNKIYNNLAARDSIAIPLDINTDTVKYQFIRGAGAQDIADTDVNEITFTYKRENVFVNRACGFKTEFSELQKTDDVEISDDSKWIQNVSIQKDIVNDQNSIHIIILH